jgi:hypothetical protein
MPSGLAEGSMTSRLGRLGNFGSPSIREHSVHALVMDAVQRVNKSVGKAAVPGGQDHNVILPCLYHCRARGWHYFPILERWLVVKDG